MSVEFSEFHSSEFREFLSVKFRHFQSTEFSKFKQICLRLPDNYCEEFRKLVNAEYR